MMNKDKEGKYQSHLILDENTLREVQEKANSLPWLHMRVKLFFNQKLSQIYTVCKNESSVQATNKAVRYFNSSLGQLRTTVYRDQSK